MMIISETNASPHLSCLLGFMIREYRNAAVLLVALALCGCGMCHNTIQKEILSPDGTKKIVIFTRDCGATTAYSSQISILDKNSHLLNWYGNAFASEFSDPVTAIWVDSKNVQVTYHRGGRVAFQHTQVDGISIKYVER